jgi:hypothetical protein
VKTVYDVLLEELNTAAERERLVIETAAPKDYADYKYHAGVLLGLRYAMRTITDLQQRQEQYDDE